MSTALADIYSYEYWCQYVINYALDPRHRFLGEIPGALGERTSLYFSSRPLKAGALRALTARLSHNRTRDFCIASVVWLSRYCIPGTACIIEDEPRPRVKISQNKSITWYLVPGIRKGPPYVCVCTRQSIEQSSIVSISK